MSRKVAASMNRKVATTKSSKVVATGSQKTNLHMKNAQAATEPQLAAATKPHHCCLFAAIHCQKPFIVPRLFEEKRRDIVFGFPSVFPSFRLFVPLKYYVPCVRNSSYSFMSIHLKLYRCFCHGLKICMLFGYYPEIIFCHFFRSLNLAIFRRFYFQSE